MNRFQMITRVFVLFVLFFGVMTFIVFNYSWLFSKTVQGQLLEIERETESQKPSSYVLLIRDQEGFMYTASAEDRQWQVARKGHCVRVTLYRYPPWDFERGGQFYNARLQQIFDCSSQKGSPLNPPQEIEEKEPLPSAHEELKEPHLEEPSTSVE